ncbi:hypothetical protein QP271_25580, partial [Escherichia coli]|nr:hypothetical protein [Escherichia coli]
IRECAGEVGRDNRVEDAGNQAENQTCQRQQPSRANLIPRRGIHLCHGRGSATAAGVGAGLGRKRGAQQVQRVRYGQNRTHDEANGGKHRRH